MSQGMGNCSGPDPTGTQTTLTVFFANCANMVTDPDDKSTVSREKKGPPLRVYVYHGNARRLESSTLLSLLTLMWSSVRILRLP
jgi:hypothetical protein